MSTLGRQERSLQTSQKPGEYLVLDAEVAIDERALNRDAFERASALKGYVHGETGLELWFRPRKWPPHCYLVALVERSFSGFHIHMSLLEEDEAKGGVQVQAETGGAVLAGLPEGVELGEGGTGRIRSQVRLHIVEIIENGLGDDPFDSSDPGPPVVIVTGQKKADVTQDVLGGDGVIPQGPDGVIHGGTYVVDGIGHDERQVWRKWLDGAEPEAVVAAIRITLGDHIVRMDPLIPVVGDVLNLLDVLPRPLKPPVDTVLYADRRQRLPSPFLNHKGP